MELVLFPGINNQLRESSINVTRSRINRQGQVTMTKNKKVAKEQKRYQHFPERYEEVNDYLLDLIDDNNIII